MIFAGAARAGYQRRLITDTVVSLPSLNGTIRLIRLSEYRVVMMQVHVIRC